jgi:hypothetical protein
MKYEDIKNILEKPSEQRTQEERELLAKACSGELCFGDYTALMLAARHGHTYTALTLIKKGADINAQNNDENSQNDTPKGASYTRSQSSGFRKFLDRLFDSPVTVEPDYPSSTKH